MFDLHCQHITTHCIDLFLKVLFSCCTDCNKQSSACTICASLLRSGVRITGFTLPLKPAGEIALLGIACFEISMLYDNRGRGKGVCQQYSPGWLGGRWAGSSK